MNQPTPNGLTPAAQTLLTVWQQHTHAEFVLKDADAALATMTENPYLLMIPTGTACVGRAAVREYYASHFLTAFPPDLELESISQTIGSDRLVEEMIVRFTHTIGMDWLLPGVRPTWRRAEFIVTAVIGFEDGKVAHEHVHWDQATLLSQMGVLDHKFATGADSVRQLSRLRGKLHAG